MAPQWAPRSIAESARGEMESTGNQSGPFCLPRQRPENMGWGRLVGRTGFYPPEVGKREREIELGWDMPSLWFGQGNVVSAAMGSAVVS